MDDEKLEREAAKIIFSAPAKPAEEIAHATPQGPEIPFVCPFCGETYQVSEDLAGKKITCRNCREPCRVDAKPVAAPEFNGRSFWLGVGVGVVLTLLAVAFLKIVRVL